MAQLAHTLLMWLLAMLMMVAPIQGQAQRGGRGAPQSSSTVW
jgi:hypothetical protein